MRAEVAASKLGITSLHLPSSAIRDHFYFFTRRPGEDRSETLYDLLRATSTSAFADLRLCYRIRRLELSATGQAEELRAIERAFNLLMHPELRSCCDALLRDADSPALIPYGGGGQCVVSGEQADDGQTFFVRQLLGYLRIRPSEAFERPYAASTFMTDSRCTGTAAGRRRSTSIPRSCRSAGILPGTSGSIWSEPRSGSAPVVT